jgi:hypothetical protein
VKNLIKRDKEMPSMLSTSARAAVLALLPNQREVGDEQETEQV